MPAPAKAVDQQDIWKDAQMRAFALALITHAVRRLNAGNNWFTTDCVTDAERLVSGPAGTVHIGPGVPGSVITKLKNAHVIKPVGIFANGKFYADSIKSRRGDAKTRPVDKYELCSREAAQEFLRRNRTTFDQPQLEMAMELPRPVTCA
ncbi:MAG TPA: hypothetical protein VIK53_19465 [Verrucomicrobiae bacterium]